jgi:hypothetical protein
MRNDLHPLLIAPPIGSEVALRLTDGLVERLAGSGHLQAATRARQLIQGHNQMVAAMVVLGIGRTVSLPSGERLEVCAPEHLLHVRCDDLASSTPLAVPAGDCDLCAAPPTADAALGL